MEAAKEWVELGANVNYIDGERTVLQAAVIANNAELVEYLLQQGADPNARSGHAKMTALMQVKSPEVLDVLARYGANPEVSDIDKSLPMEYLAYHQQKESIKRWLELGWPVKLSRKIKKMLKVEGKDGILNLLISGCCTKKRVVY